MGYYILKITDVKVKEPYKLVLTFSNGEVRMYDMEPQLNRGIFLELRDKKLFNTVRLWGGTVQWANEADFDPCSLYDGSVKIN
jgi:hypothetical protein